jgi:hypothetical protein
MLSQDLIVMTNTVLLFYFCHNWACPILVNGNGMIAALVGCRTDEELNEVLVPELAHKFTACSDGFMVMEHSIVYGRNSEE